MELFKPESEIVSEEKNFSSFNELIGLDLEPPTSIWGNLLYGKAINYLAGKPGVGKSILALKLALCITQGKRFLGKEVKQGCVILVDEENSLNTIVDRLKKITNESLDNKEGLNNSFVWTSSGIKFISVGLKNLEEKIKQYKPVLVIFDSLIRFYEGDENSSKDVKQVFATIKPLLDKYDAGFLLLHHTTKVPGKVDINSLRGSGDLIASADSVLILNKSSKGLIKLSQEKNRHAKQSDIIFFDLSEIKVNDKDVLSIDLVEGEAVNTLEEIIKSWISSNISIETSFKTGAIFRKYPSFSEAEIRDALWNLTRQKVIQNIGKGKWIRLS